MESETESEGEDWSSETSDENDAEMWEQILDAENAEMWEQILDGASAEPS